MNSIALYSILMRIRPNQLAGVAKRVLRIRPREVRSRTGHRFHADPVSVFGLKLLRDGVYEPGMTALLQALLRPGDTFVDVGGNEGYFSVLASDLCAPGPVYCIEPQSRLSGRIRRNAALNGSTGIRHFRVALSDRAGTVRLFLRPSTNTGASSLFRHWSLGTASEEVPTITLAEFCEDQQIERIRLLKIDCEGAEALVIEGGAAVLARHGVDYIALEYHPTICGVETCRRAHERLQALGYTPTRVGEQMVYHLPGHEDALSAAGTLQREYRPAWLDSLPSARA